jgi:hypothetical protein
MPTVTGRPLSPLARGPTQHLAFTFPAAAAAIRWHLAPRAGIPGDRCRRYPGYLSRRPVSLPTRVHFNISGETVASHDERDLAATGGGVPADAKAGRSRACTSRKR